MAIHHFQPTHYHPTIGSHDPVLRIAPGDSVVTTTVDAGGRDAQDEQATVRGNPQTGPFYIEGVEPGDKVLHPRDAGYEVRLARSAHRVRVLRREELIARIHD